MGDMTALEGSGFTDLSPVNHCSVTVPKTDLKISNVKK